MRRRRARRVRGRGRPTGPPARSRVERSTGACLATASPCPSGDASGVRQPRRLQRSRRHWALGHQARRRADDLRRTRPRRRPADSQHGRSRVPGQRLQERTTRPFAAEVRASTRPSRGAHLASRTHAPSRGTDPRLLGGWHASRACGRRPRRVRPRPVLEHPVAFRGAGFAEHRTDVQLGRCFRTHFGGRARRRARCLGDEHAGPSHAGRRRLHRLPGMGDPAPLRPRTGDIDRWDRRGRQHTGVRSRRSIGTVDRVGCSGASPAATEGMTSRASTCRARDRRRRMADCRPRNGQRDRRPNV